MSVETQKASTAGSYIWSQLEAAVLAPVRAFRWAYLPLLMVYFAYGALGIVAIAQNAKLMRVSLQRAFEGIGWGMTGKDNLGNIIYRRDF